MPLIRRLPKRGFNNARFHKTYATVNLDDLNAFDAGATITEQMLRDAKLIRGNGAGLKILGDGELKHALTIEAHKVSASARAKIETAGGTVKLHEPRGVQGPRVAKAPAPAAPDADAKRSAPAAKKKTSAKKTSAKS